jgi:hypothetical protein
MCIEDIWGIYYASETMVGIVANRLRFGGDSQALSRYRLAEERSSWGGTSWKGSAGQGPANRTRQALDRKGFLMSISICSFPR